MDTKQKIQHMLDSTTKPSVFMLSYTKKGQAHRSFMLDNYGGYIEIFEHSEELMNLLVDRVNYLEKDCFRNDKIFQWFFFKEITGFLFSANEELLSGRYAQSMVLVRTSIEALIGIAWISFNKESPEGVFKNSTGPQINIHKFFKDHQMDIDSWYKLPSLHSHASSYAVIQDWGTISKNGQEKSIGVLFDETKRNEIQICINYLQVLHLCTIKLFLSTLLKQDQINHSKVDLYLNVNTTISVLEDVINSIVKNHPDTVIPGMITDFNKILVKIG